MLTFETTLRARASLVAAGLASLLLGSLPGCYIDAKIGDDPETSPTGTDDATSDHGESSAGYSVDTSGAGPGTASATSGAEPGTASASFTSAGEDEGNAETSGGSGVDPETALALCGVEVVPPGPGDSVYIAGIMCAGGCTLQIETNVEIDLYVEYGECLCEAMGCGPVTGGTTTTGEPPDDTDGEPDGCGPFPPGFGEFTCSCEMCSIDVTNVDATWVEGEADLQAICACMCGGAGCGLPT